MFPPLLAIISFYQYHAFLFPSFKAIVANHQTGLYFMTHAECHVWSQSVIASSLCSSNKKEKPSCVLRNRKPWWQTVPEMRKVYWHRPNKNANQKRAETSTCLRPSKLIISSIFLDSINSRLTRNKFAWHCELPLLLQRTLERPTHAKFFSYPSSLCRKFRSSNLSWPIPATCFQLYTSGRSSYNEKHKSICPKGSNIKSPSGHGRKSCSIKWSEVILLILAK